MKHTYNNLNLNFLDTSLLQTTSNNSSDEFAVSSTSELRISRFSNFSILAPLTSGQSIPPEREEVRFLTDPSQVGELYKGVDLLSIDIETTGLDCTRDRIVGIGFAAAGRPSSYLETPNDFPYHILEPFLGRLVGYNVSFETQFLRLWDQNAWAFDVYGLYKQLANEGWKGQKWGLKDAQLDLLQWQTKGDEELGQWLVANGLWTSSSNTPKGGYISDVDGKFKRPDKSQMSKAPVEILGYYCALDSYSTLEILTKVLLPVMNGQPWAHTMRSYHQLFLENVREVIRNQIVGFTVDREMILSHITQLEKDLTNQVDLLFSHPHIRRLAGEYWEYEKDELEKKEPPRLTKAGKVSKNWEKWRARMDELDGPEDTRSWVNFGSGPQMQYLFYDLLNLPVLQRTKKDGPSVGVKAMKGFGELGQLMLGKRKIEKELGYVKACLDNLIEG